MSEKVIAWDIGLKNLSYCILQKNGEGSVTKHNYSVVDWEVINLYPEDIKHYTCVGLTKKKTMCGKKAKYSKGDEFYCKTHSPKDVKEIRKKKVKNKNPFEYATRIKSELDKRPELCYVDYVIIENQPALVNPIMKTVQIIILSYFSFKYSPEKPFLVQNINAKRKEKLPDNDPDWEDSEYKKQYLERIGKIKSKYTRRKLLCFYYAKLCLETSPEMQDFLLTHQKQDDLTDSFLMCTEWLLRK